MLLLALTLGLAAGGGGGRLDSRDWQQRKHGAGWSLSPVHVGLVLRRDLALELDTRWLHWTREGQAPAGTDWSGGHEPWSEVVQDTFLGQVGARWYPWPQSGAFTRAGVGAAWTDMREAAGGGGTTLDAATGLGLHLALGFGLELPAGPHLAPGFQFGGHWVRGAELRAAIVDIQLTLRWYGGMQVPAVIL